MSSEFLFFLAKAGFFKNNTYLLNQLIIQLSGPANASPSNLLNPLYEYTNTSDGGYVLTGSFRGFPTPAGGWPVVLVYHGGGESAQEILEYSDLSALSAVVISLQGQPSINGLSWMNAFPWMYDNLRDDVAFTEQVLEEVAAQLPIDRSRIYATGKSDGGGMSVFLAAHPELRNFSLAAIAPVAGAYFGRLQTIDRETYSLPSDAADYVDIILAAQKLPVLEMHGTADQVMPYTGGQFTTELALENYGLPGSFWGPANGFTNDVAYTASIESYWDTWARSVNGATYLQTRPFTNSTSQQATLYQFMQAGGLPLQHLQVAGGNHDWFGHGDSGPGSTTAASLQVDATQVVADFFQIPLRNYTSPVITGTPSLPLVSASREWWKTSALQVPLVETTAETLLGNNATKDEITGWKTNVDSSLNPPLIPPEIFLETLGTNVIRLDNFSEVSEWKNLQLAANAHVVENVGLADQNKQYRFAEMGKSIGSAPAPNNFLEAQNLFNQTSLERPEPISRTEVSKSGFF